MSPLNNWGLLSTCLNEMNRIPIDLVSVETRILVRGFVAQVKSTITYHNKTENPLQVAYVVPVDEAAAVYKFEAHLDGRIITAQCMEKKKAEKVYEDAVQAGHTAILAREDSRSSDVLKLNLGNLPAGTKAELKLGLVMDLKVQTDGGVNLILPTFLKPRYSPADAKENIGTVFSEECIMFVGKQYVYKVTAEVNGSHKIERIVSYTEYLEVNISEDALNAEITQSSGSNYEKDWSMIVYYSDVYKTHILRETGDRSGTGLMKDDLIMINLFPEVPISSISNKNEIIFIVDRSGSMQGEFIQSARATLLLFLKSLPVGCLFNIVSFGSTYSFLFPKESVIYSEETLARACVLQREMKADMNGTEIFKPFQAIFSQPPKAGFARQILLISDGGVWNVDQVTELVRRHAHETRVFAVGIGHGASTALIRGVARAGRGRSEMVLQQDKIQHKIMGLVTSMLQENVQNVRVSCEIEPTSRVTLVPKVPPIIFGGQHLTVYARIPAGTAVKSVTIEGDLSKKLSFVISGSDIKIVYDGEMSLHRLAARAQIKQWQIDQEEDIADEIIDLSVASGVVSRRTALVGVDQDGKVVPKGETSERMVDGFGSVQFSAESAQFCIPMSARMETLDLLQRPSTGQVFSSVDVGVLRRAATPRVLRQELAHNAALGGQQRRGLECLGGPRRKALRLQCLGRPQLQAQEDMACQAPKMWKKPAPSHLHSEENQTGFLGIVNKQKFNGSWALQDIAGFCDISLAELKKKNPIKVEEAWATALALILLETKFHDDKDQWTLLAVKARVFLAGCEEDVETLLEMARSVLGSKE